MKPFNDAPLIHTQCTLIKSMYLCVQESNIRPAEFIHLQLITSSYRETSFILQESANQSHKDPEYHYFRFHFGSHKVLWSLFYFFDDPLKMNQTTWIIYYAE